MDAPTRVLKAINHEEPDRVPAFESAFTNDTILRYHGIKPVSGLYVWGMKILRFTPFRHKLIRRGLEKKYLVKKGLKMLFEFNRKVKLDCAHCICVFYRFVYVIRDLNAQLLDFSGD